MLFAGIGYAKHSKGNRQASKMGSPEIFSGFIVGILTI
jgi:hypothetical protein